MRHPDRSQCPSPNISSWSGTGMARWPARHRRAASTREGRLLADDISVPRRTVGTPVMLYSMPPDAMDATLPRPLQHVHTYAQVIDMDRLGRKIEKIRAKRSRSGKWPTACYCPTTEFILLLRNAPAAQHVYRIAALTTWRVTQGIYRYDPTIIEELWNTPITGDIPTDLLHRLPEWCVYIEIGRVAPMVQAPFGDRDHLHGAFVYLDTSTCRKHTQVTLVLDYASTLVPIGFHLRGTLEASVRSVRNHVVQTLARTGGPLDIDFIQAERLIAHILSMVLYLCSAEPDITDSEGAERITGAPARQETRGTKKVSVSPPRLRIPSSPSQWHVGYRLGAAFRQARERAQGEPPQSPGSNASPIGHIRRAHWHTYWVGPRNEPDKRRRQLKWLPPIPVNLDDAAGLIATIRPVTK